MKICVWKTGHEIADTVADAVKLGLRKAPIKSIVSCNTMSFNDMNMHEELVSHADIHICYGILRGADHLFRACNLHGKPWFNIDKGYWKPGHYNGYYRVSLRGTQQTTGLDKLQPDYDRWDELGLFIEQAPPYYRDKILHCPPTDAVSKFYGLPDWQHWPDTLLRAKGCTRDLQSDLNRSMEVHTFNSSVGWEALRQGIRVYSDPTHSIIGAYQKQFDFSAADVLDNRRELFSIMASLQLTLDEMRKGLLWPLMSKLLSISDGMDVKL